MNQVMTPQPSDESNAANPVMNPASPDDSGVGTNAKIIYVLYLVGLLFAPLVLVGVVMAYVSQSNAPDWLRTHYRWQIRTFWLSILYLMVGNSLLAVTASVLFAAVPGMGVLFLVLGMLFWLIWGIVRCAKGLSWMEKRQAVPDAGAWWFG